MPEIRKEIFDMTDIEEKIAKAEEEIRQLQNRKRKLLNQKKDAERKARTHRLIEGRYWKACWRNRSSTATSR